MIRTVFLLVVKILAIAELKLYQLGLPEVGSFLLFFL